MMDMLTYQLGVIEPYGMQVAATMDALDAEGELTQANMGRKHMGCMLLVMRDYFSSDAMASRVNEKLVHCFFAAAATAILDGTPKRCRTMLSTGYLLQEWMRLGGKGRFVKAFIIHYD